MTNASSVPIAHQFAQDGHGHEAGAADDDTPREHGRDVGVRSSVWTAPNQGGSNPSWAIE